MSATRFHFALRGLLPAYLIASVIVALRAATRASKVGDGGRDGARDGGGRGRGLVVGSAQGLGEDLVDDPVREQVARRDLHRLGGLGGALRVAEDDGGAGLGGYDREVGVLEHRDVVGEAHRQSAAGAAFADDGGDRVSAADAAESTEFKEGVEGFRDGSGEAAGVT